METTVNLHENIVALAKGKVLFQGEYTFSTADSINAASGSFTILISDKIGGTETASGEMNIRTLWGLGTSTKLNYQGKADFNGSTGYTTVKGEGQGIMIYDFNQKRVIKASILISLAPGFKTGTLTVEGFGQDMICTLANVQENNI